MIAARRPLTLSRILALRMTFTAIVILLTLIVGLPTYYFAHPRQLQKATMTDQVLAIVDELKRGHDPTKLEPYALYPRDYGFRVFNRRIPQLRRVLASANQALLPDLRHSSVQRDGDLQSWFGRVPPAVRPGIRGWLLTKRVQAGPRDYWVQVVTFRYPAEGWVDVVLHRLVKDAFIPVLIMAPALTIAMFLTTRTALRPLSVVAREANSMGRRVAASRLARPLPEEGLPSEIADVVAAINGMLLRLQQAHDQQRQFTADVAHELRTPLSVLLLEVGQLAPGPTQRHLREEVLALSALVNELLRFAQAEDVMLQERFPVDVAAITRTVCEDLALVALRRGQEIELFGAEAPCIVLGSPPLIEIAVRNVIDNAIKYGSAGSIVSVSVGSGPHVTVEDRGPGIPEPQAERIYERSWRSEHKGVDGSGVGLALVHRVARLHDGAVRFENRPGGGARFMLSFAPSSHLREN